MAQRLQLDGDSVQQVVDEARRTYGHDIKVVNAKRVIEGGIGGFFGRAYYAVEFELPSARDSRRPPSTPVGREAVGMKFDPPTRKGIAALLGDAEAGDNLIPDMAVEVTDSPALSTGTAGFSDMLRELATTTAVPAPDQVPPVPLSAPGDLVALVGIGNEPVEVGRHMAAYHRMLPGRTSQASWEGATLIETSTDARAIRATGVRTGKAALVAVAMGDDAAGLAELLVQVAPDQVWFTVNASRKHEDSARWLGLVTERVAVHALAVIGARVTSTPQTVNDLGPQVGWVDNAPATRPWL